MKFSVWLQPLHHPDENPTLQMEYDLQLIELLDTLGYDSVWVGEHHSTGWETIGSPEVFLAAAIARTRTIKLAAGIVPLSIHHPLHVLERSIIVDHLSRGRSALGIGVGGGLATDLTIYGIDREEARSRFAASLDTIIKLLYTDEPVSVKNEWFELYNAILQLKPYGSFPIVIPTTNPKTLRLLGKVGGIAMIGGDPTKIAEYYNIMKEAADEANVSISRKQILFVQNMYLADTFEIVTNNIKSSLLVEKKEFYEGVQHFSFGNNDDEWFDNFLERGIFGSPIQAIQKIESLLEKTGEIGGLVFVGKDWGDREAQKRSYELFARLVIPHFHGSRAPLHQAAHLATQMNGIQKVKH